MSTASGGFGGLTQPFQGNLDGMIYWSSVFTSWDQHVEIMTRKYKNGVGRPYGSSAGFTLLGSEESQSGDKIIIANKYHRQDTTNQDPRGVKFGAVLRS